MFEKNFLCRTLATLQVLALIITLSPLSFAQKSSRKTKVPETVYSNPASITINTATGLTAPTKAEAYPSDIVVSGMAGNTTRVAVTLTGLTHPRLTDLDFLLVGPTGAKFVFASDLGGGFGFDDRVFTFADDAATTFPTGDNPPGSYRPTDVTSGDPFPSPAPVGPYNTPPSSTFASTYNGVSPNGTWSLYVVDDTLQTAGSLTGGWSLNITTDSTAATTFSNTNNLAISDTVTRATAYGSTINVSGETGVISDLNVTLTGYSHTGPPDVDILLIGPNGNGIILMSDTGGTTVTNLNLTFDDAATNVMTNPGNPIFTGSFKPADVSQEAGGDFFPFPASQRQAYNGGPLSNFNGSNPNGDWKLFVVDDNNNNGGSISGGWSLDITTMPAGPPAPASCAVPSFAESVFPTGTNPTNMAIADFNNDTEADLAVTNQISNDVSILLGNGSGGFGTQSLVTAGTGPYSVVAGKFNADSNFDLAVANSSSNNVSILLGNGNGTFSAATNFFAGSAPISIAVGDFNNDTKQDLAVANFGGFFSGSVTTLIGNGTGGFTAGNSVRTRTQPSFVLAANLNGDANQDLLVANFGADSFSSFFGNGSGSFTLSQNITTGSGPVAIELADFGPSAGLEIAVANYNSDNITTCNMSAAGFISGCTTSTPAGGSNPVSITSGDFIQNGQDALVFALSGSDALRLYANNFGVGQNPNAVDAVDLNGDTRPDLISVNSGSNDVSVLISDCIANTGNLYDYNGDRKTDISVFRPTSIPGWWLFPSPSPKQFGRGTDTIVPADYNGDRITDYAYYRPDKGLWFVVANNSTPLYFLEFGLPADIPMPADYDGDGKADIAVFRPSDGNWYIRRSTDNVTQVTPFGINGDQPVAADYDGDNVDDIAVFRPLTGVWYVLRSSDSQVEITQWGMMGDKTVAGDYDGDGKTDLAIWRPTDGAWYALRSSDAGVNAMYWGQFGDVPVVGDYDGDGKFDFTVWRPGDTIWYVFRSASGIPSYTPWGISTDRPIPNAYVR